LEKIVALVVALPLRERYCPGARGDVCPGEHSASFGIGKIPSTKKRSWGRRLIDAIAQDSGRDLWTCGSLKSYIYQYEMLYPQGSYRCNWNGQCAGTTGDDKDDCDSLLGRNLGTSCAEASW
jgi:hypothetical protein